MGSDAIFKEVAQAIAAMLQGVGLSPTLQTHEVNAYSSDVVPNNKVGNLYSFGWGGWTLDFDNTAYLLYRTGQFWNPCFSDETIDSLLDDERATYDEAERELILQRIGQAEHDLAIDVPLYQQQNLWGVADRVVGFQAPADDRNMLLDVSVQ